jgi:hypothetical protein
VVEQVLEELPHQACQVAPAIITNMNILGRNPRDDPYPWKTQNRIRDVHPISRILIFIHPESRISEPDPGSKTATKEEEKICCFTFLYSHKYHKTETYLILELEEKILGHLLKNSRTF